MFQDRYQADQLLLLFSWESFLFHQPKEQLASLVLSEKLPSSSPDRKAQEPATNVYVCWRDGSNNFMFVGEIIAYFQCRYKEQQMALSETSESTKQ